MRSCVLRARRKLARTATVMAVFFAVLAGMPSTALADSAPVGTLAGTINFSQQCSSGIGVGITFDGASLWYSCYDSSPDLLRADPRTGQVNGSWDIAGGLGALAYDATHNVIWAGWGSSDIGDIRTIGLDGSGNVTASAVVFNTCPLQCTEDIDDGLAYDGQNTNLLVSEDTSQTITTYTLNGGVISNTQWAGTGCYNSGIALGDQLIFEGADGCNHVYVVSKNDPATVLYDFPTAVAGDPNFRDESLTCDTTTFASQGEQVMWSKEAYAPMRAHAFVIPDGSCGVGGNPAPGGGNTGFTGPLPLLIAHGITGSADGERTLESIARTVVPGLALPGRTLRTDTGAVSSVWDNGSKIADDGFQLQLNTGAPAINVIAHSKGGLDTREAIFMTPWVFNQLGMLSTPNGGSAEANKLCGIRRIPFVGGHIESNFGPCKSDNDGLYDLQTWYVKDVFNDLVRDDPATSYYDLGSNCSTSHTTFKCNFADNALLGCRDGGDSAVCLESAYWLTTTWPNVAGGLQTVVPPLEGYSHSQMNTDPCPISDMLAQLYPLDSPNNPWIGGDGTGCASITGTNPGPNAQTAPPPALPTPGTTVNQSLISGSADVGTPFTATLNPEGGDSMVATVFIPSGVTPSVSVTTPTGQPDPNATVNLRSDADGLGAQTAIVTLSGLAGATRTLTVGVDRSSAVGLATQVVSTAGLTASGSALSGSTAGNAKITATVGLAAAQAKKLTVTAAYTDGAGNRVTVPLTYQSSTASSSTFAATVTAPTGASVAVDVTAAGAGFARYASTGLYLPNGQGSIGHVHDDTLVDTNNDGVADSIRMPVQVTTTQPGTYQLTVDLAAGGAVAASGAGQATLPAGTSDIDVTIPLARLLATRAPSGPFEVVNGTLTRGTSGRDLIARAGDMGTTASYNLDGYLPHTITLSRLAGNGVDTDGDGFYDVLRIGGAASVPAAGSYHISGTLYAPNGTALTQLDRTVTLAAGRNPLSVDLDGNLVGSTGPGTYQLRGFTVTALSDAADQATAGTVMIGPLDDSQWIGTTANAPTLSRLWDQAQQAGAIGRYGLYVSEHNRLARVISAANTGDRTTEATQLDTFIADVTGNSDAIDAGWRSRILAYAKAVRNSI